MRVVDDETLDAILDQQLKEQVFAFTPASPRGESQCRQEKVPQCCLFRIIFGGCHCQYGVSPSADCPCLAAGLVPEIANPHRLAAPWLRHHDMPAPPVPCLT